MLLFWGSVHGLYLFHKQTHSFIGGEKADRPTPSSFDYATDFKLLRGMDEKTYVTLENGRSESLDIRGGISGKLLDYYPTHKNNNQSFQLVLGAEDAFYLIQGGKCIGWSPKNDRFVKQDCENTYGDTFDIYYETSVLDVDKETGTDGRHKIPPKGTKDREFYDRIRKERNRGNGEMASESEDIDSSALAMFDGNGDSEVREFKNFLMKNRPGHGSKRKGSSSDDSDESETDDSLASSESCDDLTQTFGEHQPGGQGRYRNKGINGGECAQSDKECLKLARRFEKYIKKRSKRKPKKKQHHESECDDSTGDSFFKTPHGG